MAFFVGVRVGIERLHDRNLLMYVVHCDVEKGDFLLSRWVWAGGEGGGGGDSSVIELRWTDLIRSLFRLSLPSHFFAIDVHRHI